ncbi:hypothetical protein ACYOEI_39000, partial [Singulisphaera rosea]
MRAATAIDQPCLHPAIEAWLCRNRAVVAFEPPDAFGVRRITVTRPGYLVGWALAIRPADHLARTLDR